jgi:predicted Fe-Mo cluster-binding NifX family protein
MEIAIAASENQLKSPIGPHFGRCDWFCLFDTETRKSEFLENPVRHNHEKAGCDAADFLIKKGISMAIAGRFGSKVIEIFRANDIQMIIPDQLQTIKEYINHLK